MDDRRNIELFRRWQRFGGLQRGLSLAECEQMSASMDHDWSYMLAWIRVLRKQKEQTKAEGKAKK